MSRDLTRWNRAGLSRFRYVDGNAATYLEHLREHLARDFPDWRAMAQEPPTNGSERDRQAHLERAYRADPPDMLWQLSRSFARACHVLGEHLDTYANEATLGTATEWDNVRKLVAMLDYHPRPPASAYTALAIDAERPDRLDAGFAVRHTPEEGVPIVFETLEDLVMDPALNALHPPGHRRNPTRVSGRKLVLEGIWDQLKNDTPLVLEDDRDPGRISAGLIQSVRIDEDREQTEVTLRQSPKGPFITGYTRIHLMPKERLAVQGPVQSGARLNHHLTLTESTDGVVPGDILTLTPPGDKKPLFLRVRQSRDKVLKFDRELGQQRLQGGRLARAIEVPLSRLQRHHWREESDGRYYVVEAAGDLRWLQDRWVSHKPDNTSTPLPHLKVTKTNYWPVGAPKPTTDEDQDFHEGYTTLTLRWQPDSDPAFPGSSPLGSNPQYLLAVPQAEGPWEPDLLLDHSRGQLPDPLVTETSDKGGPGDFVVLANGAQCAWNRLAGLSHDSDTERSRLTFDQPWDRQGGGAFYRSASRCFVHFTEQARLAQWQTNSQPVEGRVLRLSDPQQALQRLINEGDRLILETGSHAQEVRVTRRMWLDEPHKGELKLTLDRDVPTGTTIGNLTIRGNVVTAGHGSHKPALALGSGDATARHQSFELKAESVSFEPDPGQASGVRAAAEVVVDDRRWTQVANLKEAGPEEAVYAVRLTEDGTLRFRFGDGQFGRRLPTGNNNVRVRYRQGVGPAANLPPGSLTQALKPHPAVAGVRQPLPASGGADREPVSALRQSAPSTLLALSRTVSLNDYARLTRGHASVWQARAFSPLRPYQRRDRVEVVIVPAEGAALTPGLSDNLLVFLRRHSPPNVDIALSAYQPVYLRLKVTLRIDLDAYDPDPVKQAAREALLKHFSLRERGLGEPLYRGELYQVVEAIRGVANSTCTFTLENEAAVIDGGARLIKGAHEVLRVIRPGDRQCVHLHPARPDIDLQMEPYSL